MRKVVLLNSGGLDSGLVAKYLHSMGYEVHSLFIDTNQLNREASLRASARTAELFCTSHKVVELNFGWHSNIYENRDGYIMYDDAEIKDEELHGHLYGCPTVGLMFCSIGTCYAKMIRAEACYAGFKGNFEGGMQERFNALSNSNRSGFYRVYIKTPIGGTALYDYQDVIPVLGITAKGLEYTHSCSYNEPCGVCRKCKQRNELDWEV